MENTGGKLGQIAKNSLINFVGEIDKRLGLYWQTEINKNFGFGQKQKDLVKEMLLHASEHNLRSSKRIRSALVYYGYLLGQKNTGLPRLEDKTRNDGISDEIWRVGEAVELIHTSLLMHDDFMDRDVVRRGKPTTQEFFAKGDQHYGDSMTVCIGDAVLCLGYERFLEADFDTGRLVSALKQLLRGITNTAFGQAYDNSLVKLGKFNSQDVLDLHYAKTALYTYETPLLSGAILGGVSNDVIEILKNYSKYAGIAFQLQDDILGVFGDEEKTGKSSNSDLLQGKVTMMYIKAMEMASEIQKQKISLVWGNERADMAKIEEVKEIFKQTGSYKYSVDEAKKMARIAADEAKRLREFELNPEAVDFLEGIATYMVEREV